jgi:hypothetical protein
MATRKAKTEAQKSADFKKLAEKHTNTAIGALARLAKLGNANKYSSTPAQHKMIAEGLEKAAQSALNGLKGGGVTGGIQL